MLNCIITMIIETGKLTRTDATTAEYEISHGWNPQYSLECDQFWGQSNLELLQQVNLMNLDAKALDTMLDELPLEDFNWKWIRKSAAFRGSDYEWFYIHAAGKPQGACVIFHPKPSALSTGNIFYVEYLAAAPWNRSSKVRNREFHAVGSSLLQCALRHSIHVLNLKPGFSLHSLPKAQGFYHKLKMVNVASLDKDSLLYFELPQDEAQKLVAVA
jgi:hypothetical protein